MARVEKSHLRLRIVFYDFGLKKEQTYTDTLIAVDRVVVESVLDFDVPISSAVCKQIFVDVLIFRYQAVRRCIGSGRGFILARWVRESLKWSMIRHQ